MDDINIITALRMTDDTVSYPLSSFVLRPSSFVLRPSSSRFTLHVSRFAHLLVYRTNPVL